MYFSGQGKVWIGTRDSNGNPQNLLYLGNSPDFKFGLSVDIEEHQESTSGQRLTDLRLSKSKKSTVAATFEEFVKDNLAISLFGSVDAVTGSTVTGEVLPNPITVGALNLFAKQNVSAVVITDSTGSPKTLPGGQYSVNAKHGSIVINDKTTGGAYVEPFKAAYTYGAVTRIGLLTQASIERWIRFEGINTADANREVVLDLYRVAFDPAKELALISDSIAKFELAGSALLDDKRESNDVMGQFGRLILLP